MKHSHAILVVAPVKLNQFNNDRENIYCLSIAENGNFVFITDKHIYASNSTDKSNLNKASEILWTHKICLCYESCNSHNLSEWHLL